MMTNTEAALMAATATVVYASVGIVINRIRSRRNKRVEVFSSPDGCDTICFDAARGVPPTMIGKLKQWLADGAHYKAQAAAPFDAARLEAAAVIGMLKRANTKIEELADERDRMQRAFGMASEELAKIKAELEHERETAKANASHPCRWYVFSGAKAATLAKLWDAIPLGLGLEKTHEACVAFWQTAHRLGLPDGVSQGPVHKSDGRVWFRMDPVYGQREVAVYYINGK